MTFSHPTLLLLLALPALMLCAVPYRRAGVVLPFDNQLHRRRRLLSVMLGALDCVPALLLAIAALLLAGPQSMQQPRNSRSLTNIQICMDVSGSMGVEGRYQKARDAIEDFVARREGDAFGLTLFGSHQLRFAPLTKDLAAIKNALPFANPERQPMHMSGTRIGAALRFCRDNMLHEAQRGDRLIVLVSDGSSSDLGDDEPQKIGDELKDENICVYHIHIASDPIPPEVIGICKATGGEAVQATDAASIAAVFRHIDRMRPAQYLPQGTVPLDDFRPFAIAGLSLLGLHLLSLLGLRYTPW